MSLYSRTNVLTQWDKCPYTVGQMSLYSRTNVLTQWDKCPYTVGQMSLYSRTNVLTQWDKCPYTVGQMSLQNIQTVGQMSLQNIQTVGQMSLQNPYNSPLTQPPLTFSSLQYSPTHVLFIRRLYAAPCPLYLLSFQSPL